MNLNFIELLTICNILPYETVLNATVGLSIHTQQKG